MIISYIGSVDAIKPLVLQAAIYIFYYRINYVILPLAYSEMDEEGGGEGQPHVLDPLQAALT